MSRILFIGATGYIGGTILNYLTRHPKWSKYETTVYLRTADKAKGFEELGFKTALGSLDDAVELEKLASGFDIVFQTADADHLEGTNAILRGLKARFQDTDVAPVFIHTSGTGVLIDNAGGEHEGTEIYSDLEIAKIEALPDSQPHRLIDKAIVAAAEEGYVNTWIVLPSTIWGIADTIFVGKGLQRPNSQQIPGSVDLALKLGKAVYVGKGENIWPLIHIEEVGKFYYVLFDAIVSGKEPDSGRKGYYFLENGEYKQRDASDSIAKALYARGKIGSPKAVQLTEADLGEGDGSSSYSLYLMRLGTNSRARGDRSRGLNWNPSSTVEDFFASIQADVDHLLKPKTH